MKMIYILPFVLAPTFALSEQIVSAEKRVETLLAKAEKSCVSDGGTFDYTDDAVTQYDFDKDGETDLTVLHEYAYICSISSNYFAGTAGAVAHLISKTDYAYGYARSVQAMNAFNNVPVILLLLHGISCDEAGYVGCVQAITIHEDRFVSP